MKAYGSTSLSEFLDDFVVYRNLVPLDPSLPRLEEILEVAGMRQGKIPRKGEAEHARVVVHLLREAGRLLAPGNEIERMIYLGDTRASDGKAFTHLAREGGWSGFAFIADEDKEKPAVDLALQGKSRLFYANRWAALDDFETYCIEHGARIDRSTAVIIDLDKTALGARGRNDHIINQARVDAVRRTVGNFLGDAFNLEYFQRTYDFLNTPEFHYFTADNQDYVAYICLILSSRVVDLETMIGHLQQGELRSFSQFITIVESNADQLPSSLRGVHDRVYARVVSGDPTPFKSFRKREYQATVSRMGCMREGASVRDLLEGEIVITQEVREAALRWKERGALLFGLSDKPDEASLPGEILVKQGYESIHRVETHAVGE